MGVDISTALLLMSAGFVMGFASYQLYLDLIGWLNGSQTEEEE